MSGAVCMMTKAPVPGRVKTRLCPPLSHADAARLAAAFALDTWRAIGALAQVHAMLAFSGDRCALPVALSVADDAWQQPEGDLGARIEHAARRALARADHGVVVGSDAPALPPALLAAALHALASHDAVLGPAVDGGYYLIGMNRCEPGILADVPWSEPITLEATRARLQSRGYSVAELPVWFDVDDAADLHTLRWAIDAGAIDAPATRALLEELSCASAW